MKRILLLCTAFAISIGAMAQVKVAYPKGFRKAEVPAALKKMSGEVKVPIRNNQAVDNGIPFNNVSQSPLRLAPVAPLYVNGDFTETIGNSKYDLQTNNSISNRLIWNNDGTISACWTFSPNNDAGYPYRGTGYNYWDGSVWATPYPPGTTQRTETSRTGFPNIIVTPLGREMTISHQAVTGTTFNRLVVNSRPVKGTGPWTLTTPWGATGRFDTWTKACGGLTNENVYVIWDASGAPATSTDPPNIINGQNGALAFSRSLDGGQNWDSVYYIPEIDSNFYYGFGGDSYSIDARGDTVAIVAGDQYTDVVLLKSFDAGLHWTKTVVMKFPIPLYYKNWLDSGTYYIGNDNIPDTIFSNAGDPKVIIDNDGMCHVLWSAWDFRDSIKGDGFYNPNSASDHLYYWNESMGEDTTTVSWNPFGGNGHFITIAATQDFNGNGEIDVPVDTFTNCDPVNQWGNYQGGLTQMPSMGIDEMGNLYVAYQALNELADTSITADHKCHRHMYTMMLHYPYNSPVSAADWTMPYNIVPSIAQGGDGEHYECVFGCMARRVDWASKTAYVLYQRDNHPGHSLAAANSCDLLKNTNISNDMVLAKIDVNNIVKVDEVSENDVFVGQNYPNPATGTTSISIGLKKSANLKIEITDLIGKVVYRESKGKAQSGNHTFTLNTSNMGKGVYTYTVTAGEVKTTRKMIVQ